MKKGFLTKAFVAVGVMASAVVLSSMCAFAAETVTKTYTFGTENANLSTDSKEFFTVGEGFVSGTDYIYATTANSDSIKFEIPQGVQLEQNAISIEGYMNKGSEQSAKIENALTKATNFESKFTSTDANNASTCSPKLSNLATGLNTITFGSTNIYIKKITVTYKEYAESEGVTVPDSNYCIFDNAVSSNSKYTVANIKDNKGTVIVNGKYLKYSVYMDKNGSIEYTNSVPGKMYLVFGDGESPNVLLDDVELTNKTVSGNVMSFSLSAKTHTIKRKSGNFNVYYVAFVPTVADKIKYATALDVTGVNVSYSDDACTDALVAKYAEDDNNGYLVVILSENQIKYDSLALGDDTITTAYEKVVFGENDELTATDAGGAAIVAYKLEKPSSAYTKMTGINAAFSVSK